LQSNKSPARGNAAAQSVSRDAPVEWPLYAGVQPATSTRGAFVSRSVHGDYRLAEIADHLGVHAATVSRRLKQAEQANV